MHGPADRHRGFDSIGMACRLHGLAAPSQRRPSSSDTSRPLAGSRPTVFGATARHDVVPDSLLTRRVKVRNAHALFPSDEADLGDLVLTQVQHPTEGTAAVVGCLARVSGAVPPPGEGDDR